MRLSLALIQAQETNQVLGLTTMFGGNLQLAETMAPEADVVRIAGDQDRELMHEFLLCQLCVVTGRANLPELLEK
jgi:hypothetical protein